MEEQSVPKSTTKRMNEIIISMNSNASVIKIDITKIKTVEDKMKAFIDYLSQFEIKSFIYSLKYEGMMEALQKDNDGKSSKLKILNFVKKPQIPLYVKCTILEQLRFHQALTKLDLGSNSIYDKDVVKIAEALMHLRSIQSIDLRNTLISLQGAKALSVALKYNNALIQLNLNGNVIPSMGMFQLSKTFQELKSIKCIDIRNKECSLTRIKPMLRVTRYNEGLREFQFL